jgi:hypothetical protein
MPWTPDEDAQLQALAVSGKSAAAIAAKLTRTEISVRSRASKLRVLLGTRESKGEMTKPPFIESKPWTPEEEDQLRTLAISGETIAAISKRLWRSEGALRHRARALGIVLRRVEKRE